MESYVEVGENGAVSFVGRDAVELMRLRVLQSSIKMHRDLGMIPTRGMGITQLLGIVSEYTGKAYKGKRKHDEALADLDQRIAAWEASLEVRARG
jgi:hypothetical protein